MIPDSHPATCYIVTIFPFRAFDLLKFPRIVDRAFHYAPERTAACTQRGFHITAMAHSEKESADTTTNENVVDLDKLGELEGYVLNPELGHADTRHLKTSADGRTILSPQPSDDPNDPLNWSQGKKNLILFVVSCTGTTATQISAHGTDFVQLSYQITDLLPVLLLSSPKLRKYI